MQDLVSRSDEGESDDGESSGEEGEEAPQEAAPDDGEGSDFDELQARIRCCAATRLREGGHMQQRPNRLLPLSALCLRLTLSSLT